MRELAKNLKDSHTEEKKTSFFFIEKIKFNCESIKDRYFTDIIFKKQNSISGWKIHLSPLLADYYEVLIEVNKICEKKRTNFKFIDTIEGYNFFTSKRISPSQFGKIITIYPENVQDFLFFLDYFYNKFKSKKGLIVPSDHIFKKVTLINYRYGGVNPIFCSTEENDFKSYIFDGEGRLIEDKRKPYFCLPKGINLPHLLSRRVNIKENNNSLSFKGKENNSNVVLTKVIRSLASGNIYLGKVSNEEVVVKEAKYGAITSELVPGGSAIALKKNEKDFLKKATLKNIPKYIDYFMINNDYYLVESKIDGINLRKFSANLGLVRPGYSKDTVKNLKRIEIIFNNLRDFVEEFHDKGLIIGDVSPDNFVVNDKNQVYLVDCETVRKNRDRRIYLNQETPIFIQNLKSGCSDYEKDNFKLGMSMFWILTKKNLEIRNSWSMINFYLNTLVKKYPSLCKIKNLILSLIEPYIFKEIKQGYSIKEVRSKTCNQLIEKLRSVKGFATTPYVKSELSLINGISGILLYLDYKNMLNEDDKNNWSKYILDHYNNTSIGSGLFFGKLGVAITLAKLGVNFERNIPLLDLLFDLNENTKKLDASLANGITGLLIGFNILSKLTTYPNFVNIRQELVKELIQNHQLSENGLEYDKLGVVFGVFFLKANDILFNNLSGPKDFEDIKNDIKQVIQEYTKNDIFLGIPEKNDTKIVYPNLMAGGAGIVLYHIFCDRCGISDHQLLRLYDVPFIVNNGLSYGSAGFILPLVLGIKFKKFDDKKTKEVEKILKYWKKYIVTNFFVENGYYGWSSDQGLGIKDDLGSGNTGILFVLDILSEVLPDECEENTN